MKSNVEILASELLKWNGLPAQADGVASALAAGMTIQRASVQKAYDELPAAAEPGWFIAELNRVRR